MEDLKIIVKVRDRLTFLNHTIPGYECEFFGFNEFVDNIRADKQLTKMETDRLQDIERVLMEKLDYVITSSGLSLDDTIVYIYLSEEELICLGIDDGYLERFNKH